MISSINNNLQHNKNDIPSIVLENKKQKSVSNIITEFKIANNQKKRYNRWSNYG